MSYFWEENEFITGDNIESLGNFIFDIGNYIDGDHGRCKTTKTEQELIDEQIHLINEQEPKLLYCYGHDIQRLYSNIHKIKIKFTLITHNSDIGILQEYEQLANNNNIIKWYGQNNYLFHPKTISLPIGIARKKYPHGDTLLLSRLTKNTEKTNLVYKNFSIDTNINTRSIVDNVTSNNGINMSSKCSQEQYLENISKSVFVISPPGNGIDCHRIWECLYLKTIPVVQYHPALEQFKHLPILFVDHWDNVTINVLESRLSMLSAFNKKIDELNFNYWKTLIYCDI